MVPHFVLLLGAIGGLQDHVFTLWAVAYVCCGAFKGQDALATAYIVDLAPPSQRAAAVGLNLAIAYGLSSAVSVI